MFCNGKTDISQKNDVILFWMTGLTQPLVMIISITIYDCHY